MTTFAFAAADDLLLPELGSTTGRAVASVARRSAFEACKARAATPADVADEALAASFSARLPGDPHAIAEALRDPRIGGPLACARTSDARLWALFVQRLRVALGDTPGTLPPVVPVFGPVVGLDDPALADALGLEPSGALEAPHLAAALEALRTVAPALAEDVSRFAPGQLAARGRPRVETALVVAHAAPRSLAGSVAAWIDAVVRAKLAIVYADVAEAVRAALADEATEVVWALVAARLRARGLLVEGADVRRSPVHAMERPHTADAQDAESVARLAPTLAELARLRAQV